MVPNQVSSVLQVKITVFEMNTLNGINEGLDIVEEKIIKKEVSNGNPPK
jgi:hypothetical protein